VGDVQGVGKPVPIGNLEGVDVANPATSAPPARAELLVAAVLHTFALTSGGGTAVTARPLTPEAARRAVKATRPSRPAASAPTEGSRRVGTPQGQPLALTIPPEHVGMLRGWFTACIEGRREDAEKEPEAEANAGRLAEAEAFEQLLAALGTYTIIPTPTVCDALANLARAIDRDNKYAATVREHEAVHGLLAQIEGVE